MARTRLRSLALLCAALLTLCHPTSRAQTSPADTWAALDAEAMDWYTKGDLPRAIEVASSALRHAASPRETGRSLDRLGFLYYTSGKLEEGERYLRQSLQAREAAFGVESADYAETANDLAMLLRDLRRMDEAQALARRAVATRERLLGADALPLAESLNTLGTVYALGGDYTTAVSTFERAKAIHESHPALERQTEEYGTLCINLAGTYQRLGKSRRRRSDVPTWARGLEDQTRDRSSRLCRESPRVRGAGGRARTGYVEAERLYDVGGGLVRRELGQQHPVYATFLNNRGFLYQSIGNATAAAASYQEALDLKRKLYGPGSLLAVATLRNLAHLTYTQDPRAGERLLAEAVDAYAKNVEPAGVRLHERTRGPCARRARAR